MDNIISLNNIKSGESARVIAVKSTRGIRRRLLDIGLTENAPVMCVGISPLGDPKAFLIRGAVIALRSEDTKNIFVVKGGF